MKLPNYSILLSPAPFLCYVIFFSKPANGVAGSHIALSHYPDPLSSRYGSSAHRGADKWSRTVHSYDANIEYKTLTCMVYNMYITCQSRKDNGN